MVGDGLRVQLHIAVGGVLDADEPGATFSEESRHVVGEEIGAAALGGLAEAEATNAVALRTRLAGKITM